MRETEQSAFVAAVGQSYLGTIRTAIDATFYTALFDAFDATKY